VDTESPYLCFGLQFDSSKEQALFRQFTDNVESSVNYNDASVNSSRPNLAQLNQYYNMECGDLTGTLYTGGGVS